MTTSTATISTTAGRDTGPARGGGLVGAIHFEWTKFWTVRSTWWSLISAVLLTTILGAIVGLSAAASGDNGIDVTEPAPHTAVQGILLAQLALITLATLTITAEYSSGAIRTTLQAVPVRGRMYVAKGLVLAAIMFVTGCLLSAIGTAVVGPLMGDYGTFTTAEAVGTALGVGAFVATLSLLVMGVGTMLRSAAGTITSVIVLLLALPPILQISGVGWLKNISDYLPSVAGNVLMTQQTDPYGAFVGLAVLGAWAVTSLVGGWTVLRIRDA